jgi:hypothetical protein
VSSESGLIFNCAEEGDKKGHKSVLRFVARTFSKLVFGVCRPHVHILQRELLVLYCTVLYYTTLYYTTLHYTTLYYTILYYTILYYTVLYYTILYYIILYYNT